MGAGVDECRHHTTTDDCHSGRTKMKRWNTALRAGVVGALCVCIGFAADTKSTEWPTYGHDLGGMRFSPLKQITPANVVRLQRAWVYHMKPPDARLAGSSSMPLV